MYLYALTSLLLTGPLVLVIDLNLSFKMLLNIFWIEKEVSVNSNIFSKDTDLYLQIIIFFIF